MNYTIDELLSWKKLGRVLYVGAHFFKRRMPLLLPEIRRSSESVDLLEVFKQNCIDATASGLFDKVIQGDVRDWSAADFGAYDTVVWWHGPEHLVFKEAISTLRTLAARESAARVWIGCPYGHMKQGIVYGNEHEIHKSALHPEDFHALGYTTNIYLRKKRKKITAWRIK